MTREQYEALRARLAEISYYEPAVIDGIAEQALDGVKDLLARVEALQAENAALRARAVPEVVWSDPTDITPARAKFGKLLLIAWEDGEWRILFGEEQLVEGDTADLETAKVACVADVLRLVGAQ